MEILFRKISSTENPFETEFEGIRFSGVVKRESKDLVLCKGNLNGEVTHICDRCGNEFELQIDEDIELFASDGTYEAENSLDIIEFYDGILDLNILAQSEVEALRSDYNYCDACNKK
jgi:hypothetical protein